MANERKGKRAKRAVIALPTNYKDLPEKEKRQVLRQGLEAAVGSLVAPETGEPEFEELPDDPGLQALAAGTSRALTDRCSDPDEPGILLLEGPAEGLEDEDP